MYMFNHVALFYGATVFGAIAVLMLFVSWRDTFYELRLLFDSKIVRRFLVSLIVRCRSWHYLLVVGLPICICLTGARLYWQGLILLPILDAIMFAIYLTIVAGPLVVFFYSDAFGESSHVRWKYLFKEVPAINDVEE